MNRTEMDPGPDSHHILGKDRELATHKGIRLGKKGLNTSELRINSFIYSFIHSLIHLSLHIHGHSSAYFIL